MSAEFATVTEIAGDDVSAEQVERTRHRYIWAASYCSDKDVLEIACGTGQGLGLLASLARSLKAGDISRDLVERARAHYGDRVAVDVMDAQALPLEDASLDVVIMFEALYYIPQPERFFAECRRVLRPGGRLLIVTTNKDMDDFNPSPYSHSYHGTVELAQALEGHGFNPELFGYWPYEGVSARQRLLRPVKRLAIAGGLIPKTMAGKKLLKRIVFGSLVPMPAEITADMDNYVPPVSIPAEIPDRRHRVIYCAAQRR